MRWFAAILVVSRWKNQNNIDMIKKFELSSFDWYQYRFAMTHLCHNPSAQSETTDRSKRTPCVRMAVEATGRHTTRLRPVIILWGSKCFKICLDIIVFGTAILFTLFYITTITISIVIIAKIGLFFSDDQRSKELRKVRSTLCLKISFRVDAGSKIQYNWCRALIKAKIIAQSDLIRL